MDTKHVVNYSAGACSWCAAKRVAERHGTENLILLFADTQIEDEDTYRFLEESAANVGGTLVRIADGRDPWQVFRDRRFIGNTRVDLCSRILKRELLWAWIRENCNPVDTIVYLGLNWDETNRLDVTQSREPDWKIEAPLEAPPYLDKKQMLARIKNEGIEIPRLYNYGFPHNNCGGFCVKAGQAQFQLLLRVLPDRYRYHEEQESEMIDFLGKKNISILRDRSGGTTKPMSLKVFRERLEAQPNLFDCHEWGGCACGV